MAKLIEQKCCERCRHEWSRPCPKMVECLVNGPQCHEGESCSNLRAEQMTKLRRQIIEKPVFFVGTGTCGLGAGAGKTLATLKRCLDDRKMQYEIIEVGCIGLCSAEPMVDIQLPGKARVSFHSITEEKVPMLLEKVLGGIIPEESVVGQFRITATAENTESTEKKQVKEKDIPGLTSGAGKATQWEGVAFIDEHPFFAPQTRWVLKNCGVIDPNCIEEYIANGGYQAFAKAIRERTPVQLCDEVEKSGLRGRGGGGFPTGKKWRFALAQSADQKYLICNADEGDPGAFMDRAVIEGDPHRLLEGMGIAAYSIGANKAYVYIRAEYPLAIRRLKEAIAQAKAYGLLGHNILDSGFSLEIVIKQGAGAFVCGEETALIASIEGRRGMPRPRPPFPAISGLFGKPTVINNVETLANLPEIASHGSSWFSTIGTASSKGTKVFALSGRVARTGLVEVTMGTKIRDIVFNIGGGIPNGKAFKAVQIGGPSGGCIPTQHLDIEIDYESLKTVGAMMGSGGLVVMDETTCMVDLAKFFMDFIQRESCGKCIPCREGTRRMLEILKRITAGRRSEAGIAALERFKGVMYLNRLAEVIKDTSLCGLGQTAPNPVLSTLRWFRDEYEAHVYERTCPAGACTELLHYAIHEEKCKGCTLCAKKCPVGAIMGKPKSPHYIIPDKCISCGACFEACPFKAIEKG